MSSSDLLQHFLDALMKNDVPYVSDNIHRLPINAPLTDKNETAMHLCAQEDHINMMKLLLRHGALVNCRDAFGYTPLHSACLVGATNIVQLLIKSGAVAIDVTSRRGITPLMIAAWQKYTDIATLLIVSGATMNVMSQDGLQALHYAALSGDVDVCKLLLDKQKHTHKAHGISWQNLVAAHNHNSHLLALSADEHAHNSKLSVDIVPADDAMPQVFLRKQALDEDEPVAEFPNNTGVSASTDVDEDYKPTGEHSMTGEKMGESHATNTTGNHFATTNPEQQTASTQEQTGVALESVTHTDTANHTMVQTAQQDTPNDAGATDTVITVTGEGLAVTGNIPAVSDTDVQQAAASEQPAITTGYIDAQLQHEKEHYSFDKHQLQQEVNSYTEQRKGMQNVTDTLEPELEEQIAVHQAAHTRRDPTITEEAPPVKHEIPLDHDLMTDAFDVSRGLFRAVNGMYTNNVMILTIGNLLATLDIPHEVDRSMQGTVTPGEQTPSFSFFDRNGNVIVWEVLDYDPFENNNISRWNYVKLWYQNNGFSYDVNFFMSHANSNAVDSKEIYDIAQNIKQQM